MKAGVAAGHPATAEVGSEILADGGTAADAVVAMALASCVAETVMSGLLAGCHAIAFDGSRVAQPRRLRGRSSSGGRPRRAPDRLRRRDRRLLDRRRLVRRSRPPRRARRALGAARAASVAPAVRAGARSRTRRRPAARRCTRARSRCSARSSPSSAAPISSPATADARATARLLVQPGLVETLDALAEEGAESVYRGSLAEALLAVDGVVITAADLARLPPALARRGRRRVSDGASRRAEVSPAVPELLPRLPTLRPGARPSGSSPSSRRSRRRRSAESTRRTWSPSTATAEPAFSRTRSASEPGVWVPGFDVQLNNLLGETDIAFGDPRRATTSRAAWRRPSPSTTSVSSSRSAPPARRGCGPPSPPCSPGSSTRASTRRPPSGPRVHPTPELVDAEPGVDETRSRSSRRAGGRSAAGIGSTTTSAASAASGERAPRETRGGAAALRRYFSSSRRCAGRTGTGRRGPWSRDTRR